MDSIQALRGEAEEGVSGSEQRLDAREAGGGGEGVSGGKQVSVRQGAGREFPIRKGKVVVAGSG